MWPRGWQAQRYLPLGETLSGVQTLEAADVEEEVERPPGGPGHVTDDVAEPGCARRRPTGRHSAAGQPLVTIANGPTDVGAGCQSSLTAIPYFVHSGWITSAANVGVTVVAPAAARELASSEKNSSKPPGAYMYNTRAG